MEIKDLKAAMLARHSVRSYLDKPIPQEIVDALRDAVQECNTASGLHIQLVVDEPQAFGGFMAHYGKFSGVKNYFALVGPKGRVLDERLGYYGAQLTLLAPTAMNQQKFRFGLTPEGKVTLKSGVGFYALMDLGIARRFFEIGAAPQVVCWE